MKKRIISLLLALILALSLLPIQTVVAEDEGSAAKSVVKNMQICLSVTYNGKQVDLTLPGLVFDPNVKEYFVAIPETWGQVRLVVTTDESGNGCMGTLSVGAKKASKKLAVGDTTFIFPMMTLSTMPGKINEATFAVGEESYTFKIIRSSNLQRLDVFSDEECSENLKLAPDFTPFSNGTYAINVPLETTAIWMKTGVASGSRKKADLYVGGEKCENTTSAEVKVDLTKFTPDENGSVTIPIEVRYKGAAGTGQSASYALKVNFVDCMPVITEQPQNVEVDKGKTAVLSVDATCTKGELSYQWYAGDAGYLDDEKPIEGATGKTLEVVSQKAGKTAYICYVTNLYDGGTYLKKSNWVTVETKLSYITPAEITEFSGGECIEGEEKIPLRVNFRYDDGLNYIDQKVEWYRNTVNSTTGGELIRESWDGGAFIPQGETPGTYYYYCVVTLSDKAGKVPTVKTVSNGTLKIVYKPYGDVITLPGAGTEKNPYKISSLADLETVRSLVEQGYSLQNQHFLLTTDISLPVEWKPIGKVKGQDAALAINDIDEKTEGSVYALTGKGINLLPFSGILDGGGHTITVAEGGLPLLGIVRAAEVRNLNIFGKKIASYGLVHNYIVDYGTDGDYSTGCPATIVIDHVTLKENSSTLRSGFIGGFASGANTVEIRNCVVEKGVTIGYDTNVEGGVGSQSIGSFAGDFNGTVTNCVSYATVNGKNYVGGLVGLKGQSMGPCIVQNSQFYGTVNASGKWAGGILGSGYYGSSAPNTPIATVKNCLVAGTVNGGECVGGIFGGEPVCENCWANGTGGVRDNVFCGKLTATGNYKGGIVGFMKSVNENVTISNNYYLDSCGAGKVVGKVEIIDDKGFTDARCGAAATTKQMRDGTVVKALNSSESGFKNWVQGAAHPELSDKAVVYELTAKGTVSKQHYIGEKLDLTGITLTAKWSDGTTSGVALNDPELKITGFDTNTRGQQTVTLSYGAAKAEITVTVLLPVGKDITVTFSLLGDSVHGNSGDKHTLADGNLEKWIDGVTVTVGNNATVLDVITKALGSKYIIENKTGNYIQSITPKDGTPLGEFTNGNLSGWMYTLNGKHSDLGVAQQYLVNGDVIVFHYTDDYSRENAFDQQKSADEVITMIAAIGTVSLSKGAAISQARTAYDKLSADEKALVTNYDKLLAAEAAYAKLVAEMGKKLDEIYKTTGDFMGTLGTPTVNSTGGEWMVIGLARSGRTVPAGYYDNVVEYVKAKADANERLHRAKVTDNARVILALTAIGKDVTNVGGHNLLKGLDNMDYVQTQGINGPIFTLIALDSHNYPTMGDVTREKLIQVILDAQLNDGGWDLSADKADPDMTAMAIQALAPYYKTNETVKAAVDKALEALSALQRNDGGFGSWGTVNSESCAQVIVALTALGIDPTADSRFVKNGHTVLDALAGFYVTGGGFRHTAGGERNDMATEQGYYALAAYYRFANAQTRLYDMTDVTIQTGGSTVTPGASTPATGDTGVLVWVIALPVAALAAAFVLKRKEREE